MQGEKCHVGKWQDVIYFDYCNYCHCWAPSTSEGCELPREPIAPVSPLCNAHLADFLPHLLPFWLSAGFLHIMMREIGRAHV